MPSAHRAVPANEDAATTQSLLTAFERDVVLATGRTVHVRPTVPADVGPLRAFYGVAEPG